MKPTPARFDVKISGFIVGLLLVTLLSVILGSLSAEVSVQYGTIDNTTFGDYDKQQELVQDIEDIQDATEIRQNKDNLDVIGGFFSSGYAALKTALKSFEIFSDMSRDAQTNLQGAGNLGTIINIFKYIIIVLLILGLALAILLKART